MLGFTLSALALSPLAAGVGADTPAPAGEWRTLDRELEALAATLAPQDKPPAGLQVSGFIKTAYDQSSDLQSNLSPLTGDDLGGFGFDNVRVNFTGKIDDYSMRISIEGRSGTFVVADAFGRMPLGENLGLQMGQFKSRFLFSYFSSEDKKIFYRNNAIARAWGTRDTGVQLDGRFGPVLGILQLQNGGDGASDEWALTGKAIWAAMGKMMESQSGGYGPNAETALTVGVGYYDDSTVDNSSAISVEAIFTSGPIFAFAEAVDHDDGFTGITSGSATGVAAAGFADSTPWDAVLGWMFNEHWEVALEYQDDDAPDDTTRIRGGVNYYVSGHKAKWQLNYTTVSSDTPDKDGDLITLGLTVSV